MNRFRRGSQRDAVWFDAHQVLHLDGKPTSLGLYNTTLRFYNRDIRWTIRGAARLEKMAGDDQREHQLLVLVSGHGCAAPILGAMAEHGHVGFWTVNNVYPPFPSTPRRGRSCRKRPAGNARYSGACRRYQAGLAARMSELSNFLGWYAWTAGIRRSAATFHQRQVLAEADPAIRSSASANKPAEISFWRDTVDVLAWIRIRSMT